MTKEAIKIKFEKAADLSKAIESIGRRGQKLDNDIQDAALSCLWHLDKHGDITLLERLWASMPKGARRNALADWAAKFGKLTLNMDKASNKEHPFLYDKKGNTDLAGAAETKWFDCKPEKGIEEEFDFEAKVHSLLRHLAQAQNKGLKIKGAEMAEKIAAALKPEPTMEVIEE